MDTVLFLSHIRGLKPLLVFNFRVEEKFAGGKFREIPFAVDIIFARGKFRANSKFAKIAKIYSTRKIGVIQYSTKKVNNGQNIRRSLFIMNSACNVASTHCIESVGQSRATSGPRARSGPRRPSVRPATLRGNNIAIRPAKPQPNKSRFHERNYVA